MEGFPSHRVNGGDINGNAARGGHLAYRRASAAAEYDHPVAAPGARSRSARDDTQGLRRAACGVDLLQLIAHREPQELAVRRPERRYRALRTRESAPFERVEVVNPETALIAAGVEHEFMAV